MPGRKPTPTHLKVLRGNPGHRPLNEHEATPVPGLPDPPAVLDAVAQAEWVNKGRQLVALGLMTEVDTAMLAVYCAAWSRWLEALEKVAADGAVITTPSGYQQQSPWVSMRNQAEDRLTKAAVEFGMSPSARSRVTAAAPATEDRLQEFLDGAPR